MHRVRHRVCREYYRGGANARMGATMSIARSTHPCSPRSLWRRYAFAGGSAQRKDGTYALTTFEEVTAEDEDDGGAEEVTIYEADGLGDDVSDCLGCNFFYGGDLFEEEEEDRGGYSSAGFYMFGTSGDRVEWTFDTEEESTTMRPISFRHSLGKTNFDGLRPLALYVNDVLVDGRYAFGYTGGWNRWMYSETIDVPLSEGTNTIRLVLDGKKGPYIDHLRTLQI